MGALSLENVEHDLGYVRMADVVFVTSNKAKQ